MKPQERAKQLAADHWGYTGKLLELTGVVGCDFALCEYLYKAAAVHFYGHAVEDCQNGMFGIFGDDVDEVALEAELDRSCGNAAADAAHANRAKIVFTMGCPTCLDAAACSKTMHTDRTGRCLYHRLKPSPADTSDTLVKDTTAAYLCLTCGRDPGCVGDYPRTKGGGCEGYIPSLREKMLDAKQGVNLCTTCGVKECEAATPWGRSICSLYVAKQEAPTAAVLPLDFTLPSIALKCTAEEAMAKYHSEVREWGLTVRGTEEELIERWDCLQALRTYAERGGDVADFQHHVKPVMHDLARYHAEGRDVMGAKAACLEKNARRSYYSPEVCSAIIASKGHRFQPLDEMGVI